MTWAFPENYNADDSWIVRSRQRGDKRVHNSTTKVSFCTIIIRLCHCMILMQITSQLAGKGYKDSDYTLVIGRYHAVTQTYNNCAETHLGGEL